MRGRKELFRVFFFFFFFFPFLPFCVLFIFFLFLKVKREGRGSVPAVERRVTLGGCPAR